MSLFTDIGENYQADFLRGQGMPLPAAWYVAPLSAAIDGSVTEVTGTGIERFEMTRSLTNWSGTQGAGTTLASNGTSHRSSNNVLIDMGTAASAVGTVTHVGFFDDSVAGDCWFVAELGAPLVTDADVNVQIAVGQLVFELGLSNGLSDYLCNKWIDKLLRGAVYNYPTSVWQAAFTAPPSNAGGGTEVGGGVGYARLELESSLEAISGTQGAGTTDASNGSSGRISTNLVRAFANPTGPWGDIGWTGFYDVSSAGNLLWQRALGRYVDGVYTPMVKTIVVGVPLTFDADACGFTIA